MAQDELDGFDEVRAAIAAGDLMPVVVGLLHIQARLFHAIETVGNVPEMGTMLIDSDLASPTRTQPAATTATLRCFRALLKSTYRPPH